MKRGARGEEGGEGRLGQLNMCVEALHPSFGGMGGGEWGGRVFKKFRSHIILLYTPAMTSRILSKLILATLCVKLLSRVLIT